MICIIMLIVFFILLFTFRFFLDSENPSFKWETHKVMIEKSTDYYGKGCWNVFEENFKKRKWLRDRKYPESIFDHSTNSQIHASIIQFDGIGMLLNKRDYKKFLKFMKEEIKNIPFEKELFNWGCDK